MISAKEAKRISEKNYEAFMVSQRLEALKNLSYKIEEYINEAIQDGSKDAYIDLPYCLFCGNKMCKGLKQILKDLEANGYETEIDTFFVNDHELCISWQNAF